MTTSKSYFADFESQIRKYLQDKEVRRELVREMTKRILSDHGKIKAYPRFNNFQSHGNPDGCYVEFSDALIDGVTAIVLDELGKSAK